MQHQFSIHQLLHYLDDFLCVCSGPVVANQQLSILLRAFVYLGVPLAPTEVEGPLSYLTFLGITLDCIRLEARLPLDSLVEIRSLLTDTVTRRRNLPTQSRVPFGQALIRCQSHCSRSNIYASVVVSLLPVPRTLLYDRLEPGLYCRSELVDQTLGGLEWEVILSAPRLDTIARSAIIH